jgi:general secretion pathway protein A
MYENFFGFKEKPFKLVPNPDYLFLSKSHEEALAHLNYALSQGDGFVEITGEVGTGKTTLCRAFLENLNDDTIAAYIFNPRLGPKQLIRTINDELGIKYETDNTKDLIDHLNNFLMRQKSLRKKVMVLIDEAQNLSKNVLEQLRLLSNLETNKEKLLQIILVGQPELSDILDSHELRQLGQRITLRYHLSPLTPRETVDYIQYRINIAAQKSGIKFDRAAFRRIYRYSRGIPRVINITCDRVLLTAFGLSRHKITGSIARDAIRELKSRGAPRGFEFITWRKVIIPAAALCVVLAVIIFHQPLKQSISPFFKQTPARKLEASTSAETAVQSTEESAVAIPREERLDPAPDIDLNPIEDSEQMAAADTDLSADGDSAQDVAGETEPQASVQPTLPPTASRLESTDAAAPPEPRKAMKLADYLTAMDIRASRFTALKYAMELWQSPIEVQPYLNSLDDDEAFFRLNAKPKGLFIHRLETNLDLLKRLNLPAILELFPTGSEEPGYLTLVQINGDKYIFGGPGHEKTVVSAAGEINLYWSGIAYVPWKNFLSITGIIPKHSNPDSIITLKLLLHELGFNDVRINSEYDNWTRRAVEEIQGKYGIPVDGFVGPLTKMILYQEKSTFEMPHLKN